MRFMGWVTIGGGFSLRQWLTTGGWRKTNGNPKQPVPDRRRSLLVESRYLRAGILTPFGGCVNHRRINRVHGRNRELLALSQASWRVAVGIQEARRGSLRTNTFDV